MPPWLQRYASGKSIDQLLEKFEVDGVVYYKTTDGKRIAESELGIDLTNARVGEAQEA